MDHSTAPFSAVIAQVRAAISGAENGARAIGLCDALRADAPDTPLADYDQMLQRHALYDAAAMLFATLDRLPSVDVDTLAVMAQNAFDAGNPTLSADRWQALLHRDPTDKQRLMRLIRCLLALRDVDAAQAHLDRLARLADTAQVALLAAEIQLLRGNTQQALALLDAGITTFPKALFLALRRAAVLTLLGRAHDAETALQTLHTAHPDHIGVRRGLALTATDMGRIDLAKTRWQDIIASDPSKPNPHQKFINCLFAAEGGDAAQRYFDTLHDLLPPAALWMLQIRILTDTNQGLRAIDYIDTVLADPAHAPIAPQLVENLLLRKAALLVELHDVTGIAGFDHLHALFAQLRHCRPMSVAIRLAWIDVLIAEGRDHDAAAEIALLPDCADRDITLSRMWQLQTSGDIAGAKSMWTRESATMPIPQVRACAPGVLERLDTRQINAHDGAVTLFTVVKNERARLPWFLAYYRRIGVRHFVFIDNGSTDDSAAYLRGQPDVVLYRAHETYAQGYAGVKWINALIDTHAARGWVLYVDVDEALVLPGIEHNGLSGVTAHMDRHGQDALTGFMLDMFSDRDTQEIHDPDHIDYLRAYPLFDNHYRRFRTKICPFFFQHGGVRRHFGGLTNLTKTPLFRGGQGIKLRFSSHAISPAVLSDVTCVLLHFKFTDNSLADFRQDMETGTRAGSGKTRYRGYIRYLEDTQGKISVQSPHIERYVDSDTLLRLGLLHCPADFHKVPV